MPPKAGATKQVAKSCTAFPIHNFPSSPLVAIEPLPSFNTVFRRARALWTTRCVFEFIYYGPTSGSKFPKNARNQSVEAPAEAKEADEQKQYSRKGSAEGFDIS